MTFQPESSRSSSSFVRLISLLWTNSLLVWTAWQSSANRPSAPSASLKSLRDKSRLLKQGWSDTIFTMTGKDWAESPVSATSKCFTQAHSSRLSETCLNPRSPRLLALRVRCSKLVRRGSTLQRWYTLADVSPVWESERLHSFLHLLMLWDSTSQPSSRIALLFISRLCSIPLFLAMTSLTSSMWRGVRLLADRLRRWIFLQHLNPGSSCTSPTSPAKHPARFTVKTRTFLAWPCSTVRAALQSEADNRLSRSRSPCFDKKLLTATEGRSFLPRLLSW